MIAVLPLLVLGLAPFAASARADELAFRQLWPDPFVFSPTVGATGVAHAGGTVYVIGGTTLYALDMGDGRQTGSVALDADRFAAITSVAARGSLVAVTAVPRDHRTAPGSVLLYGAQSLNFLDERLVGATPDMLTFTPDGSRLLVANEGEPECRAEGETPVYVDPEGSVSVVELAGSAISGVHTVTFAPFDDEREELIARGVRVYGPNATVSRDFEPEHIAVGPLGARAWVTLQENNAIALLDLLHSPPRFGTILPTGASPILPLGDKDHGAPGNAIDVSDEDGVNPGAHPNLFGMYLPDGINAGFIGGRTYLFTANEGDARDYPGCFTEEARVGTPSEPDKPFLSLDPASFTSSENDALKRLRVTINPPRDQPVGVFRELFALGGRSFAVWTSGGQLVHDSGDTIERELAARHPGNLFESRSDDKGPEPEDLVVGRIGWRPYLFVGLERADGVMAFGVGDPANPRYAGFLANPPSTEPGLTDGQRPERLAFVPAHANPATGRPLLLVTNEVTRTIQAFEIEAGAAAP